MIDYVVMLDSQQRLCTDVQVMGGANCWTNHQMVRVNVCVDLALSGSNKEKRSIPFAVHELCNKAKADAYCKCLSDYLQKTTQSRDVCCMELEAFEVMYCPSVSTLGHTRQKQPDWLAVSTNTLMPLIQKTMKHMRDCSRITAQRTGRSFTGNKE